MLPRFPASAGRLTPFHLKGAEHHRLGPACAAQIACLCKVYLCRLQKGGGTGRVVSSGGAGDLKSAAWVGMGLRGASPRCSSRLATRCSVQSPAGRTPSGAPAAAEPRSSGLRRGGACPWDFDVSPRPSDYWGPPAAAAAAAAPNPHSVALPRRRQGGGGMKPSQERKQSQQVTWQVLSELCNESRGIRDPFHHLPPTTTPSS